MIPQPFVKGGGERVFFGPYEYPTGADIVFDFGNPICTSAFGSNIVYNAGSANVTASLIPYNNPGPIYPTLSGTNGGIILFNALGSLSFVNYMQWNWKSTEQQTNVVLYKPTSADGGSGELGFPLQASGSANSLYSKINGAQNLYNGAYNSSNVQYDSIFGSTTVLDSGSLNGRNGWNALVFTADSSSSHYQYINMNTSSFDNTTITRVTSGTQRFQLANRITPGSSPFNTSVMAYLQYPKILSQKEIRQINRLFAQRYFT